MDQNETNEESFAGADVQDKAREIIKADLATKISSAEANERLGKITLGRVAYEAHMRATGGADYAGRQMPPWAGLPAQVHLAWEATAKAVEARVAPPRSAEEGA